MGATAASPAPSRPQLLSASYQASARVLRAFPAGLRHAAAAPGGTAWFWLSRAQRNAALDNYAAALGRERSDPEVARVARSAFQNYGRVLMDFLLLGSLTPQELMARMSVDGLEHLDAGLARGKGVIMATPHMGSWDMAGAYAGASGDPTSTGAARLPPPLTQAAGATPPGFGFDRIFLGPFRG